MKSRLFLNALVLAAAATVASGAALADGDAAKGKRVFNKCKACHSLEAGKNKIGPSLAGIIGRKAGTAEGFKYSSAMQESGIVWDEDHLSAYLTNPRKAIPGNKMAFAGLRREADRENLIAYLKEEAM